LLTIRDARPGDASDLHRLQRALAEDGRGMVIQPSDVLPLTRFADNLDDALRDRFAPGTGVYLVAIEARIVVGEATLYRFGAAGVRHVGVLTVGVNPFAQGRGVGLALISALLERAPRLGLSRVELYVRADNDRAIRLYERVGFVLEGRRRCFVRLSSGEFIDDLVMGCLLPAAG